MSIQNHDAHPLCVGVCIAWGDKKYNDVDGTVTEEKQIGFGIGLGGSIFDVDVGFYFIIRGTWVTDAGGTQHHQPGSAFSMSLTNLLEFQSATTVDLNND